MHYTEWNDKLAAHFFKEENSGQQIYVHVTLEVLKQIVPEDFLGDFRRAMLAGPPGIYKDGICHKAWKAYEGWTTRNESFPPYFGYLCLFALAADWEAELPPHSYYPRLGLALGVESTRPPSGFEKMAYLWIDLEEWTTKEKQGALGFFKALQYGGHEHIGFPLFQSLISAAERRSLPKLFREEGLDPENLPSEAEVLRLLQRHPELLRPKTVKLLNSSQSKDSDRRSAFIGIVFAELAEWDCDDVNSPSQPGAMQSEGLSTIVLCCDIDKTAGSITLRVRCRSVRGLPEEGWLEWDRDDSKFFFSEEGDGWSSHLILNGDEWEPSSLLDGRLYSWRFSTGGFKARWKPKSCFLFIPAADAGMSGYMEVNRIQKSASYHVLIHARNEAEFVEWAGKSCRTYKKQAIESGLLPGWNVYAFSGPVASHSNSERFPSLVLPSEASIRIKNGISIKGGRRYFDFCPPKIFVDGLPDGAIIKVNGKVVEISGPSISHEDLVRSAGISPTGLIRISVDLGGFALCASSYTVESSGSISFASMQTFESKRVRESESEFQEPSPIVPYHLFLREMQDKHVLLIGRIPGEIFEGRPGAFDGQWQPIWLISDGRRPMLHYVGQDLLEEGPGSIPRIPVDSRSVRWAEMIWRNRKKIQPQLTKTASSFWRQYLQRASIVLG